MGRNSRPIVDIMALHNGVTGSCIPVVVKFPNRETEHFAIDFGLFQEKEYESLNKDLSFKPENLDFCLVTHVHVDHIGRLPYMVKKGFYKNIYATVPTCKLMPIALGDSYKVLSTVAKLKNERCLYSDGDVGRTLGLLKPCEYNQTIKPVGDNIKVTFFKNGHLVGASIILVQISYPGCEDINLLFTGDYNNKNIFFDVPKLPKWVTELPLTVICESTYGDMESSEVTESFEENILGCLNRKGTAVSLVFSLGRAQEVLFKLKLMQDNGTLDKNIPIYFDGSLAITYTQMYMFSELGIREEMKNFLPTNLTFVNNESRLKVLRSNKKKIIVTTSGMGTHGPAQSYIPAYITNDKALIQFTGYTAEGTLGYKLKNAINDDIVEIGGLVVPKRAEVQYTPEWSAHAKADELIEFLKQFMNLKLVLFNHGEPSTKVKLAERAVKEVKTKNVGILDRQYFFRVDAYGLVKTLSTKFQ